MFYTTTGFYHLSFSTLTTDCRSEVWWVVTQNLSFAPRPRSWVSHGVTLCAANELHHFFFTNSALVLGKKKPCVHGMSCKGCLLHHVTAAVAANHWLCSVVLPLYGCCYMHGYAKHRLLLNHSRTQVLAWTHPIRSQRMKSIFAAQCQGKGVRPNGQWTGL